MKQDSSAIGSETSFNFRDRFLVIWAFMFKMVGSPLSTVATLAQTVSPRFCNACNDLQYWNDVAVGYEMQLRYCVRDLSCQHSLQLTHGPIAHMWPPSLLPTTLGIEFNKCCTQR